VPNISITDFTDFVLKIGPPKITKVAEVFNRGEYHPAKDFWKPLRDTICEFHEGKASSISFGATGANAKKNARYDEAITGYLKFLKKEQPVWFKPIKAEWTFEDLIVRINPEVGFKFGEDSFFVKLYFKQEPLAKNRVQVALGMMSAAINSKKHKVAILDVPRAKLHHSGPPSPQMNALLKGEAATFLAIWNSMI